MTKSLPFLNASWFWLVVIIAISMWLVFIWKDRLKYPSLKFFIHAFISLVAITALSLIALRPLTSSSNKPFKTVILTNNHDIDQLDSLKKAHNGLAIHNYSPGQRLHDASSIPESVFVLGDGIKTYDLWQLDSIETKYLGGYEPKGIINLKYDAQNKVGNRAIFNGRYQNAIKGHTLLLIEPGEKLADSVMLSSELGQNFQLAADIKASGKFLYYLIEKDTLGNIVSEDPLPMVVADQNQLKLLVINDFPTFETKYLKNYLANKGHQVLIRSQLTKDRYKYEYFNMNNRSTVDFNQKNLKAFDLLIIDANSMNKLSRRNRNSIEKSVIEDGLGVFIQPDQGFFKSNNRLASFSFQGDKNTSITLKKWPKINIATFPYKFRPEFSLQPIHMSSGKTVSAYNRFGVGRIGSSLVQNSYELLLNGHSAVYQELWSRIIENLSKKEFPMSEWNLDTPLIFRNEPLNFRLRTQTERPIISSSESPEVTLNQDPDIESLWRGTTYPKEMGWKSISMSQDSTTVLNYYVMDTVHWTSLQSNKTIMKNKRHFDGKDLLLKGSLKTAEPMNPIWFFMTFLICVGYLWLEPKL